MKATITKETLNKLYRVVKVSEKIMYFERNVRLSAFYDIFGHETFRHGTTLPDIDDDFRIPINNLPLFISMIETVMGKSNSVEIEYDVTERDFGLDKKKLYTVDIINGNQHIRFYSAESEEFETITPKDLADKSKISKLPESHIRFNLNSENLKIMDKNCKILNADTLMFKNEENDVVCRIYNSSIPDTPVTEIRLEVTSFNMPVDFPLSVYMFIVIDKNLDYDVVINCERGAILFANESEGTFYISAKKNTN